MSDTASPSGSKHPQNADSQTLTNKTNRDGDGAAVVTRAESPSARRWLVKTDGNSSRQPDSRCIRTHTPSCRRPGKQRDGRLVRPEADLLNTLPPHAAPLRLLTEKYVLGFSWVYFFYSGLAQISLIQTPLFLYPSLHRAPLKSRRFLSTRSRLGAGLSGGVYTHLEYVREEKWATSRAIEALCEGPGKPAVSA